MVTELPISLGPPLANSPIEQEAMDIVIAKKIEGNPLDPDKTAKDQIEDPKAEVKEEKVPTKKN